MMDTSRILEELADMQRNPHLYIDPVTPEVIYGYLSGLHHGIVASGSAIKFEDFVDARRLSMIKLGITPPAAGPIYALRGLSMSDSEIIEKLIEMEIEVWRLLIEWEKTDR